MSHWTKNTASLLENADMSLLEKACIGIGIGIDHSIKQVGNSYGERGRVDAGITKDGRQLSLGFIFKKENGKTVVQIEGDFWTTGLNERTFIGALQQSYQRNKIAKECEEQGWFVDVNKMEQNGHVTMEAYQWA